MSVLLSGLDFNSGAIAEISLSARTLSLVVPPGHRAVGPEHQQSQGLRRSWKKDGSKGK